MLNKKAVIKEGNNPGLTVGLTGQHLFQINGQQQIEDTVQEQHEQRRIQRMRTTGQGGEYCTVSLSLQVHHLSKKDTNNSKSQHGATSRWTTHTVRTSLVTWAMPMEKAVGDSRQRSQTRG